ncbi:MAG: 2-oxo acid dehydrogenase subunit E2 [Lentisphaerae bacterium]|nr:2-oxo acid dehydrogenase subunit E2 [Lentisphaerota bacterium]
MAQAVVMPKLGQTVEESTIVKWHKKTGDAVKKGDIIFEIETDKAILEIESFFDGTLLKIVVPEGLMVPVGTTVAFLGKPGDPIPAIVPPPPPRKTEGESPKPAPAPAVKQAGALPSPKTVFPSPLVTPAAPATTRKCISPRARALIRKTGIHSEPIQGTGPGGRVTEKDVLLHLEQRGYRRKRITPAARALALKERIDILEVEPEELGGRIGIVAIRRAVAEKPVELNRMRQVIARRLTQSATTVPHFFVTVSVDMTDLLALVLDLKERKRPCSLTAFLFKAVALALKESPVVNSTTDGKTVRWNSRVNLGMAVALENGLVVPVIRDADRLSLDDLQRRIGELTARARAGQLTPDEMTGGTFTISNMGMLGVENFTAIINPGESAILAVSSHAPTPVAIRDRIVIRSLMKMTLSADHRLIDGAAAAKFINRIKHQLEDIESWKNMTLS